MKYPKLNEKLLKCVLKFLEDNPENYNQNTWLELRQMRSEHICGTTGCIAGWTCMLTLPEGVEWKRWAISGGEEGFSPDFSKIAKEKLGLTDAEAYLLFRGTNLPKSKQLAEIKRRVAAIRLARKKGLPNPYEVYNGN